MNASSPPPPSFEDIKAAHDKFAKRKSAPKVKLSNVWNHYGESKHRTATGTWSLVRLLVTISSECGDLSCPFLKTTPIALRRVTADDDIIEVDRQQTARPADAFDYTTFFDERIETKKRDNSYRVFKRIQRKSGLFPRAAEKKHLNNDDEDARTITVWCSNDYLGLGQHPKLKQAVM